MKIPIPTYLTTHYPRAAKITTDTVISELKGLTIKAAVKTIVAASDCR